jgi:hypothetical protein
MGYEYDRRQAEYITSNLRDFIRHCADKEEWLPTLEKLNEVLEADGVMSYIYPPDGEV